jgi:hypothetical protein
VIATLRLLNLVLRVLLEIGALAAFAYWGVQTADGVTAVVRAGGAMLLGIVFWGTFVAPRSLLAVPPPLKSLLALAVFVVAAAALVGAGEVLLATVFVAAAWGNVTLTRLLGEPVSPRPMPTPRGTGRRRPRR